MNHESIRASGSTCSTGLGLVDTGKCRLHRPSKQSQSWAASQQQSWTRTLGALQHRFELPEVSSIQTAHSFPLSCSELGRWQSWTRTVGYSPAHVRQTSGSMCSTDLCSLMFLPCKPHTHSLCLPRIWDHDRPLAFVEIWSYWKCRGGLEPLSRRFNATFNW
jgi:hypothetical protein